METEMKQQDYFRFIENYEMYAGGLDRYIERGMNDKVLKVSKAMRVCIVNIIEQMEKYRWVGKGYWYEKLEEIELMIVSAEVK